LKAILVLGAGFELVIPVSLRPRALSPQHRAEISDLEVQSSPVQT
jgi:hypothetical protein